MFRIGEFSKLTKTTVKTLRYYDEMGLLKPEEVDGFTGYRYYTTRQLYPLQRILALRQAGLSLEEVSRILAGASARDILLTRKAELESEIAQAEDRLTRLTCIIHHWEEDATMQHQAIVKTIPACTVYMREDTLASYAEVTPFIGATAQECFAANPTLQLTDPPYTFINYLDGEYRETDIRIRFAQAVQKPGKDTGHVSFQTLAPVEAVCVYHRGAYDRLGEAYAFALSWLEQNGYRVAELARECYLDGVWNKPNVDDWLTEIQIPILKG